MTTKLADVEGPSIASSDYMSDVPDQIRQFVPNPLCDPGAPTNTASPTPGRRPAATFTSTLIRWWYERYRPPIAAIVVAS